MDGFRGSVISDQSRTALQVAKMESSTHRQFPRVPDLSQVDRSDPVAVTEARDQAVREQFVALEELKMLREQLRACYERHGVDHLTKCEKLSKAYIRRLRFPNYIPPAVSDFWANPLLLLLSFACVELVIPFFVCWLYHTGLHRRPVKCMTSLEYCCFQKSSQKKKNRLESASIKKKSFFSQPCILLKREPQRCPLFSSFTHLNLTSPIIYRIRSFLESKETYFSSHWSRLFPYRLLLSVVVRCRDLWGKGGGWAPPVVQLSKNYLCS